MINFIICENDKYFVEKINSVIEKFIFKTKYKYKVYVFKEYSDKLDQLIKKNIGIKIYILDIELDNNTSGLNVAKSIRGCDDWDSIIVFNTAYLKKYYKKLLAGKYGFLEVINKDDSYEEKLEDCFNYALKYKNCTKAIVFNTAYLKKYYKKLLAGKYGFLEVINKDDSYEEKLEDCFNYALKYKNCTKAIVFNTKDILYRFFTSDILYIYVYDRKSIIVTDYTKIAVTESLSSIYNKLDWRFQYSHKSCIINIEKITKIYKNKKIICFLDTELELVSYKYLKIIMSLLRENNINYILIS